MRIEIDPGKFEQEEVDIRATSILVSQVSAYHPMPVCTYAIAPTEPDSQYKPGESR